MKCKSCEIEMSGSKALSQGFSASEDFLGDPASCVTYGPDNARTYLIDCLKCPKCGWSVTK